LEGPSERVFKKVLHKQHAAVIERGQQGIDFVNNYRELKNGRSASHNPRVATAEGRTLWISFESRFGACDSSCPASRTYWTTAAEDRHTLYKCTSQTDYGWPEAEVSGVPPPHLRNPAIGWIFSGLTLIEADQSTR
jgi:hypothetical protein